MARRTLLRKLIVKFRMFWADVRGHHGMRWDYEPVLLYERQRSQET